MSDLDRLQERHILLPVQGFDVRGLRDNFAEQRGTRVHEALDLLAPRGTPVLAVDDGLVKKLFNSKQGGLTVYHYDPTESYAYYYAHLDRYAEGLTEGQALKKGDRVGYVGTSGNAPPGTPHLHFTIFKLGLPEKRWWEGTPINPFPLWAQRR
jgi:peptidoglycan LD-endopeptidase LytH